MDLPSGPHAPEVGTCYELGKDGDTCLVHVIGWDPVRHIGMGLRCYLDPVLDRWVGEGELVSFRINEDSTFTFLDWCFSQDDDE